jgi:hypothetical protein
VKLLNNPKLAQNVLKRLNKKNETEPESLNTGVAKFGEIATVDTHLVLWSTRATPGISASHL